MCDRNVDQWVWRRKIVKGEWLEKGKVGEDLGGRGAPCRAAGLGC